METMPVPCAPETGLMISAQDRAMMQARTSRGYVEAARAPGEYGSSIPPIRAKRKDARTIRTSANTRSRWWKKPVMVVTSSIPPWQTNPLRRSPPVLYPAIGPA